nr:hypothetical protein [Acidobacteriota bacterium]
ADKGPNLAARQARMNDLDKSRLVDEDTVLPAVPLWYQVLDEERAQGEIDHLGGGHLATDWGARIISDESKLYDPLSYHNGSVWPLFTGWASMGAYRYGRPHVGFQALMSNALLQRQNALGYVTELLSGDFNSPFGRSSHHQVWSEAMTVTPTLRGLLGIEAADFGSTVRFAPQLPADWDSVEVRRVAVGSATLDLSLVRGAGQMSISLRPRAVAAASSPGNNTQGTRSPGANGAGTSGASVADTSGASGASTSGASSLGGAAAAPTVILAPAFPLDARVRSVKADGHSLSYEVRREGDVQRVEFRVEARRETEVRISYDEGSDVYLPFEPPAPGARSESLRVLRSHAEAGALRLLLEGVAGHTYLLNVKTQRIPEGWSDFDAARIAPDVFQIRVPFDNTMTGYVKREVVIPLRKR